MSGLWARPWRNPCPGMKRVQGAFHAPVGIFNGEIVFLIFFNYLLTELLRVLGTFKGRVFPAYQTTNYPFAQQQQHPTQGIYYLGLPLKLSSTSYAKGIDASIVGRDYSPPH